MREGQASVTSMWVAAWRGLGAFDAPVVAVDPHARSLVPRRYGRVLEAAERWPRLTRAAFRAAVLATGGLARHLPLRTRAIDDVVAREVANGTDQLVLLGAGLDARAHRLEGLASTHVFEVDHPASQADKRVAAGGLPQRARSIRYVGMDFSKDDLRACLGSTGFDAAKPAVFVWEGVTMYLSRQAIEATLANLHALAAPRSALLATYYTRHHPLGTRLVLPFFALAGEPLTTRMSGTEMAELLALHGFAAESDEGDAEWSLRWSGKPCRFAMSERLVTARVARAG